MGSSLPVVLLPSLGRPASDFDALVDRLRADGRSAVAVDPPADVDAFSSATLHDLVSYVMGVVDAAGFERFDLIGHAFGNRLARCLVADHPARVRRLVLLAAGGRVHMAPEVAADFVRIFDGSVDGDERLPLVQRVFFAPGGDAASWRHGWLPAVARMQRSAMERTPPGDWWDAVAERVVVIQGLQDVIAVPENGRAYVADHPDVASLVEIDGAGHALLPEQPEAIAAAVLAALR